jgi:nucleoside-diphosphate-sugar epimerase
MNVRDDLAISRVIVSGATGFIGSRLIELLLDNNGDQQKSPHVTALVRERPQSDVWPDQSLNLKIGDLTNPESLVLQPDEMFDVVFHLAAATPERKTSKKTLIGVNLEGAKNLFSAICDRAKHFVYVSGIAVFEPADPSTRIIDENSPKNSHLEYVRIRTEAEEYLREGCKKHGIDFTVVHFADIVYGNGGAFKRVFLEQIRKGKFRIPGSGDYISNFIHLDDAAGVLLAVAQKRSETAGQSYLACDSKPAPFKVFVNYIADQFGVKHPGSAPIFLAKAAVGSELIEMLTRNIRASNAKIANLYKFQFPTFAVGLPDVVSQFKNEPSERQ